MIILIQNLKKNIMRRKYKRKRGPVVSKKTTYDGIQFASGLEKYMMLWMVSQKEKHMGLETL